MGETTRGTRRLGGGTKRLGGKRPGRKRLGGETIRGGNGLGAKRLDSFVGPCAGGSNAVRSLWASGSNAVRSLWGLVPV